MKRPKQIYTFIGMSGSGKSYWSKKFQEEGYKIYPIDDLISEKIVNLIQESGDENVKYEKTKVGDLARWMGFPGDKRYKTNSKKYLKLESKITLDSLKRALQNTENAIIDTTGSVIYTDKKTQNALIKNSKIVFLNTPEKNLKEMFKIFCAVPKPIIWGDIYKAQRGEKEDKTLARCYKLLLNSRIKKYEKLANKTLDFNWLRQKNRNISDLLKKM